MNLQPMFIAGSSSGLQTDKQPFLLPDQAFSTLENAYVYRERVKKREGIKLVGRLRRVLTSADLGTTGATPWTFNIYSTLVTPITGEPDAQIKLGSVVITITAPNIVFTDQGDGTLTSPTPGNSGVINYITGSVTLTHTAGAGLAVTITFSYFPSLPVMGIPLRDITNINDEQTIFFDTKYAYRYVTDFEEYISGTTWSAGDANFFWSSNYRGITASDRLFFTTNFINDASNPIRYTDGTTWTSFAPGISGATSTTADTNFMFQAKIIIPYYGRLLALNTWEGTTIGGSVNIYNRCRFSQIGNPVQATSVGPPFVAGAWRSDVFGKGGFLDAPTNESIVSAQFYKNTLIVFFERSTWNLRYVGEYGLPFIWERISSDYGSESKMSPVLFDPGVLAVGDKGIISSNAVTVDRIDLQIPDLVFSFRNAESGIERVHGIRDFQRELVFWNYSDSNFLRKFPNRVLVYNYRNSTYAIFRDNVTAFGSLQFDTNITWDRTDIYWDDEEVYWDDFDTQSLFPFIVIGNQQGYIHIYGETTLNDVSLAVSGISTAVVGSTVVTLTIVDHNLEDGEIIFLQGLKFLDASNVPIATDLNDQIYSVTRIDDDTVYLSKWNTTNQEYETDFTYTPTLSTSTYVGGGEIKLFPRLNVQTKDFNPYQEQGGQFKLSYLDFLMDATPSSLMTINLILNSSNSPSTSGNLMIGNQQVPTSLTAPYYLPSSKYAWHRFYATAFGQYLRIQMTYDEELMNTAATHSQTWVMNALSIWTRPGGRITF